MALVGRPDTGEAATDGRAQIQALLDTRSRAVLDRDRAAFLATVDAAAPEFRRRQAQLFDGLASLDLESYRLVARWGRLGDLTRASDRARYPGADEVTIPLTEERYRLAGFDDREAVEDLFYTFVRRGETWVLASDTDLEDVGLESARHLWDAGPVTTAASRRFELLGHPCDGAVGVAEPCAKLPGGFLDLAEDALDRVNRVWRLPWARRVVIVAPGTTEELARMIQATFPLDDFLAFAVSSVDPPTRQARGTRIMLNWPQLQDRSSTSLETILVHELVHVATRPASGPFVPSFVEEGIAEYVADVDAAQSLPLLDRDVASGTFDGLLPEDYQFTTGGSDDILRSYQKSQSAVTFFIEEHGLRRFVRFYRLLGTRRVAPGVASYHLDLALRRVIGRGTRAFAREWASSIASP